MTKVVIDRPDQHQTVLTPLEYQQAVKLGNEMSDLADGLPTSVIASALVGLLAAVSLTDSKGNYEEAIKTAPLIGLDVQDTLKSMQRDAHGTRN